MLMGFQWDFNGMLMGFQWDINGLKRGSPFIAWGEKVHLRVTHV